MQEYFLLKSEIDGKAMVEGIFLKFEFFDLLEAIETISIFKLAVLPYNKNATFQDVLNGDYDPEAVRRNLKPHEDESLMGFQSPNGNAVYAEQKTTNIGEEYKYTHPKGEWTDGRI